MPRPLSLLPPLPPLSENPTTHPHCCLGLSTTLIEYLKSLIVELCHPQPSGRTPPARAINGSDKVVTAISIGSGAGLLEAHLQRALDSNHHREKSNSIPPGGIVSTALQIEAVEVYTPLSSAPTNRYLLDENVHIVHGTWDICPRAFDRDVRVWLFVYPRTTRLVREYWDRAGFGCYMRTGFGEDGKSTLTSTPGEATATGTEAGVGTGTGTEPEIGTATGTGIGIGTTTGIMTGIMTTTGTDIGTATPPVPHLELIIWAGPKSDWPEYQEIFQTCTTTSQTRSNSTTGKWKWAVEVVEDEKAGVMAWERLAVIRRVNRDF